MRHRAQHVGSVVSLLICGSFSELFPKSIRCRFWSWVLYLTVSASHWASMALRAAIELYLSSCVRRYRLEPTALHAHVPQDTALS